MLSRSSSAYQPLEKAAAGASSAGDDDNDGNGKSRGGKSAGGGAQGVEMTSIAVISNHPFRAGSGGPSGGDRPVTTVAATGANSRACADLDFKVCKGEEKTQWTNFHFIMCIGIGGFFIFWILLLSRMYLPPEFQWWGGGAAAAARAAAAAAKNSTEELSGT